MTVVDIALVWMNVRCVEPKKERPR